MAEYRLYCLDGAGQIAGVPELLSAPTDQQAIAAAHALQKPVACELWLRSRLIAQIPPAEQS